MASFQGKLVAESDSLNAISWVSSSAMSPWFFQLYFKKIKDFSSLTIVEFKHVG